MGSYYFEYRLQPLTKVSAGRGGQVSNLKHMQQIIRGGVLRGALGAAWWNDRDPGVHLIKGVNKQQVFDDTFGRYLHFHQALPQYDQQTAQLQPVSSLWCKYQPYDACREKEVIDLALTPLATDANKDCPHCQGKTKNGKGWKIPSGAAMSVIKTALDDEGVAEEQHLFAREVYRKDVEFIGTLRLDDADPQSHLVKQWLETPRRISVGGRLSTFGRVKWSVQQQGGAGASIPTTERVALRLRSTAILVDDMGFPTLDLSAFLESMITGSKGKVVKTWVRPTTESGWNAIAGMPKPTEWALEAGSVALLEGWDEASLKKVAQGIGLRQTEGFGEIELVASKQGSGENNG